MPRTLIRLEGVTRTYHLGDVDVHALAGVDLRVEEGEFLALMGASGSGKSTLMNILGCLDRPTSGRYLFEGVDVADRTEPELARIRSERIGFVFQSFNLLARSIPTTVPPAAPSGARAPARPWPRSAWPRASATRRASSRGASSSGSRSRAR